VTPPFDVEIRLNAALGVEAVEHEQRIDPGGFDGHEQVSERSAVEC
jgi:hypothetical protein